MTLFTMVQRFCRVIESVREVLLFLTQNVTPCPAPTSEYRLQRQPVVATTARTPANVTARCVVDRFIGILPFSRGGAYRVKSCNHIFDENAEIQVLQFNISQRVAGNSFLSLFSHKASSRQQKKKNRISYFPGVFRDQPRRRKMGTISGTDAIGPATLVRRPHMRVAHTGTRKGVGSLFKEAHARDYPWTPPAAVTLSSALSLFLLVLS